MTAACGLALAQAALPPVAGSTAPHPPAAASVRHGASLPGRRPSEREFLQRAERQLRRNDLSGAVRALEQGLAVYPRSAPLHYVAARILAQEGDEARARAHYQRVVALAPNRVEGYFGLAQVAFARHDYAASATALRHVIRLQPGSATAYAKLGQVYAHEFHPQQAIAALNKALALDPGSEEGHYYLGDLMLGISRLDEAQQHLERAIALDPGNAQFYARLGDVFLERQQTAANSARALSAYQQAIRLDPRLAGAHYGLGRLDARQRRWSEAADELRAALRLDPGLGRAHYTLAQAYRRLGQPAAAESELKAFTHYRAQRVRAPSAAFPAGSAKARK